MTTSHGDETATASAASSPTALPPLTTIAPTHRSTRSHFTLPHLTPRSDALFTLPHLTPRSDALFTPRHTGDAASHPHPLSLTTSASPVVESALPPTRAVAALTHTLVLPGTAAGGIDQPLSPRARALLSAPVSHSARTNNNASAPDDEAAPSLDRPSSLSATAASVMAHIRSLTGRASASVSPRPISPDTADPRPHTPAAARQSAPTPSEQLHRSAEQSQRQVYDISPSSTARPSAITPSPTSTPRRHQSAPSMRQSIAQPAPQPLHQRLFSALDSDGNGFIGTQDLLRAVRAVRRRAAGGGSSSSSEAGQERRDEALVECMLSMASWDDDEDADVDEQRGQLSYLGFERMVATHWPASVVSQ